MVPESGSGMFGDVFNLLLMPQEDLEALSKQVSSIGLGFLSEAASLSLLNSWDVTSRWMQ